MSKKGYSEKNMFGGYTHRDSKGKVIGRSEPDLFGGYTDYDAKGRKIGKTRVNVFGGFTHYDNHGKKTGSSSPTMTGGYTNYDAKGKKTSDSSPDMFGGYTHSEGCYIATCVYGSYDCPEVMTLRRFRDDVLKTSMSGRLFIRTYYAVSPSLVRHFGNRTWFRSFWKQNLDRMVNGLRRRGF